MTSMYRGEPHGSVVAVEAILTHLLSHLVAKGILAPADVQIILADAANELMPEQGTQKNKDALDVIAEIVKRFP